MAESFCDEDMGGEHRKRFVEEYMGVFPDRTAIERAAFQFALGYYESTERFDRGLPHRIVNGEALVFPEARPASNAYAGQAHREVLRAAGEAGIERGAMLRALREVSNALVRGGDVLAVIEELRQRRAT